ncbi:MAG TPA: hypothetical protein VF198_02375 [Vicinamibacterales bacterium]
MDVTNPADAKTQVLNATAHLEGLVGQLPQDPRTEKALYHLDRLRRAVNASHQEAVRFAAFTVNKTIRDAAADWGSPVVEAMDRLRDALEAAGHRF